MGGIAAMSLLEILESEPLFVDVFWDARTSSQEYIRPEQLVIRLHIKYNKIYKFS